MTDKLAEAIKHTGAACDSGLMLEVNVAKVIVDAARSYHALPVVDVVRNNCAAGCIDYLRATYPDGLRWAE